MMNNSYTNIEHIIAKIDNDFNPDNSDWIPRVAAWCIQAMEMLDCLPTEKKRIKLNLIDRIATHNCIKQGKDFKVFDECGQELKEADNYETSCCGNKTHPSTGNLQQSKTASAWVTADTVIRGRNNNYNRGPEVIAQTVNTKHFPARYNVTERTITGSEYQCERNYVFAGNNKIEVNYDGDYVILEYNAVKTCENPNYPCALPIIPNNGILIEALGYYCLYKMLCRGYKHPVFNLAASQYGTNPYYEWTRLKDEAKRSIINNGVDIDDVSNLFNSNFFINTFQPRNKRQ